MRLGCSFARSCEAKLLLGQVRLSQGYDFCSTACAGEQMARYYEQSAPVQPLDRLRERGGAVY